MCVCVWRATAIARRHRAVTKFTLFIFFHFRQRKRRLLLSTADMGSLREEKVKKFEEFVDRRLKPDLVHAIAERDKVFEQQKVFSDLKRNIENLERNGVTSLRTLVNLGSEVYMHADVPDTRHIFLDIGLGFHVELTWTEALEFISVKEARLSRCVKVFGSYLKFLPSDTT
ncbi:uncharacterized protein LOC131246422 isoform X2 [Magnolia sinica]|uniref:uncharacterized protein LOC131246422 isoform X2 n=1 Tax=Magnolia sinica TaxID=86752 RepID=UPI00265B518A|nr:uncharacterized protein LOC131246422 isoform X2 [Magnolia sinica]